MRLVRSPGAVGLVRALELVELVDLVGQASRAGEETKDRRYLSDVVRDNVEVYDLTAFFASMLFRTQSQTNNFQISQVTCCTWRKAKRHNS